MVLLASSLFATTITQTILNPDGTHWNGRIAATLMNPVNASGDYVVSEPVYVQVRDGILNWNLACGTYSVVYTPSRPGLDVYWIVPCSGSYPISGTNGVETNNVVCSSAADSWTALSNSLWTGLGNSAWEDMTN